MTRQPEAPDEFLTPADVAAILYVDPKTVTRWAKAGKIDSIRTPGGHRRFLKSDVLVLLTGLRQHHPALVLSTAHTAEQGTAFQPVPGTEVPVEFPATLRLSEPGSVVNTATEDAAAAVVAEAVAIALKAEAEAAAEAVLVTAAAVAAAADKAAGAAARARGARAFAAAEAARLVASEAIRTAEVMQSRAETAATQVAQAAARAASILVASGTAGQEAEASLAALRVAATVKAAADATAQETTVAAASVASAVAAAAAHVAMTVSAVDTEVRDRSCRCCPRAPGPDRSHGAGSRRGDESKGRRRRDRSTPSRCRGGCLTPHHSARPGALLDRAPARTAA